MFSIRLAKLPFSGLSAILCLLFLLCSQSALALQPPMIIHYVDFWPFHQRSTDGQMTGFFHEIVTEAFDRMGIKATWHAYPWSRCQEQVKNGEADAMLTVPTAERLVYSQTHPTPFYQKKLTISHTPTIPKEKKIEQIKTIDDILKLNLSVITYIGNGWNDRHIRIHGIKTYETPNLPNVWPMLAHKRGDIVIEWPGAAWPAIHKAETDQSIVQTAATLQALPFHLMIRKTSPYAQLLPEFDRTIRTMQKDGTIDRIVKEYFDQPAPPK